MSRLSIDGYILATKTQDGLPDKMFGSVIVDGAEEDEEAVAVFVSLDQIEKTRQTLAESGQDELHIFKVNMKLVGEVIV